MSSFWVFVFLMWNLYDRVKLWTLLVGELCSCSKGRLLTAMMAENAFFVRREEKDSELTGHPSKIHT